MTNRLLTWKEYLSVVRARGMRYGRGLTWDDWNALDPEEIEDQRSFDTADVEDKLLPEEREFLTDAENHELNDAWQDGVTDELVEADDEDDDDDDIGDDADDDPEWRGRWDHDDDY